MPPAFAKVWAATCFYRMLAGARTHAMREFGVNLDDEIRALRLQCPQKILERHARKLWGGQAFAKTLGKQHLEQHEPDI